MKHRKIGILKNIQIPGERIVNLGNKLQLTAPFVLRGENRVIYFVPLIVRDRTHIRYTGQSTNYFQGVRHGVLPLFVFTHTQRNVTLEKFTICRQTAQVNPRALVGSSRTHYTALFG
jgi:hypothetical protein